MARQPVLLLAETATYGEVADDVRASYRTTGRRTLVDANELLAHLDRYCKGSRVGAIAQLGIIGVRGAPAGRRCRQRDDRPRSDGATATAAARSRHRQAAGGAVRPAWRRTGRRGLSFLPLFDDEPHVLRRLTGEGRVDFRKAWSTTYRKAGVRGRLTHDSAGRVRSMVSEGGHAHSWQTCRVSVVAVGGIEPPTRGL